jgi:hypothetical protein
MALTSVQLTHELEKAIRSYLIKAYQEQFSYSVPMLALYSVMEKQFPEQNITTGFFNKIVGDMRRAGIVDISKSLVSISRAAWKMHEDDSPRCSSTNGEHQCVKRQGHYGEGYHRYNNIGWFDKKGSDSNGGAQ